MTKPKRDRAYQRCLYVDVKDLPRLREIIDTFRAPDAYVGTSIVNDTAMLMLKIRKRDLLMVKLAVNLRKVERR